MSGIVPHTLGKPGKGHGVAPAVRTTTVTIDQKGRLAIPRGLREELGLQPGDTLFVRVDDERQELHFAKAENPFDALADHAMQEFQAGRTRNVRDFAAEESIDL